MIPLTDSLPAANRFHVHIHFGHWSIEGEIAALTPEEAQRAARTELTSNFPEWAELLSSATINVALLGPAL